MRILIASTALASLIVTAGCKKAEDVAQPRERAILTSQNVDSRSAPDINLTTAHGVAFAYRYEFVLPDKRIAAIQEKHAAACETLGPTQCRITGMRYTLLGDERTRAELDLKLAPQLARSFGQEGIAAVEKVAGKLVEAEINGDDVGSVIDSANRNDSDASARLAQVEVKLKAQGLGDQARSELEAEAAGLRNQISEAKNSKTTAQTQLASTPVTFNYTGDIGFTLGGNPVGDAVQSAWSSFSTMIWFVLTVIGIVLPWALLIALLITFWRSRTGFALRTFLRGKSKSIPKETTQLG